MGMYDDIVDAYIVDLRRVRTEVLAWWDALLHGAAAADRELVDPERLVRPRWPAGPVSHPRVIAVFRYYYLMIEALNEEVLAAREARRTSGIGPEWDEDDWGDDEGEDEEGVIEPRFLLLDGLEARDPELAAFMSRFVFIPIGANPADDTA